MFSKTPETVSELVDKDILRTIASLTGIATGLSFLTLFATRSRCVRALMQKHLNRTFSHDVLYERFLEFKSHQKKKRLKDKMLIVVFLKSGRVIKGAVESLSDGAGERDIFLTNPTYYPKELQRSFSPDVFCRDSTEARFADGTGVYLPMREVEKIWVGIDETKFTMALGKLRESEKTT